MVGPRRVEVVLTPADCTDGFASAYWRRPEQYLSPSLRANISVFARLDPPTCEPGMAQLARDLASGVWHRRHSRPAPERIDRRRPLGSRTPSRDLPPVISGPRPPAE